MATKLETKEEYRVRPDGTAEIKKSRSGVLRPDREVAWPLLLLLGLLRGGLGFGLLLVLALSVVSLSHDQNPFDRVVQAPSLAVLNVCRHHLIPHDNLDICPKYFARLQSGSYNADGRPTLKRSLDWRNNDGRQAGKTPH